MDLLSSDILEFDNKTIKDLSYENEQLTGYTFRNCIFDHCTFLTCNLEGSTFVHCTFKNCSLSAVKVRKTRFEDTKFIKSKVIGVDWTDKFNFKIKNLSFVESVIDYSVFNGITLIGFTLKDSQAHEVDFIESDLSGANCEGTDFDRSNFLKTRLRGASFIKAKNYLIDPTVNKVKGMKVSMPEAMQFLTILGLEVGE
jgi:uncharacterized protein YjbI with pentapeptide repeats